MPRRTRGITPRRRTRAILNYPIPIFQSDIYNINRKFDEISDPAQKQNVHVVFQPGIGWTLDQYNANLSYVHERVSTPVAEVPPTTGVLMILQKNDIQRAATELTGVNNSNINTTGDGFYQKTVGAGNTWDAKLTSDITAWPPPNDIANIAVDRVFVSNIDDTADGSNWFRFFVPGAVGQTPVGLIARFYFTAVPTGGPLPGAGDVPLGCYCVSIFGDAHYVLWEKIQSATSTNYWYQRFRGRWTKQQDVAGRWHSLGILTDVKYTGDEEYVGSCMTILFEDQNPELIGLQGGALERRVFVNGQWSVTENNLYKFNNSTNIQPLIEKIRVDVRRDIRFKFNCYYGTHFPTGTLVSYPFSLFSYPRKTSKPFKVQLVGNFPYGDSTTVDIEMFAADGTALGAAFPLTVTHQTARKDFYPLADKTAYYVKVTMNSVPDIYSTGGTRSPLIQMMTITRDAEIVYSNPTPTTITGLGVNGIQSVSISGEGRDFTTSTASLVVHDLHGDYALLLDNKAGFPIKIEVDTLDNNDSVVSTTRVFEGRVVRAEKKVVGRSRKPGVPATTNTNPTDPYPARFWGKYTIYCTGMWQMLYESTIPTAADFAKDPDAAETDPPTAYKVRNAIGEMMFKGHWPLDRLNLPPDTGVGAIRFPLEQNYSTALRIEPMTRVGDVVVSWAKDFMGAYFTYDYNAQISGGIQGIFRVILPPLPDPTTGKYRRLAAFRTTNTTTAGITTAENRMPDVTNYAGGTCKQIWILRDSLCEWVEPPEGNFVIATGTGYAPQRNSSNGVNGSVADNVLYRSIFNYQAADFGFPSGAPYNFPQPLMSHPDYTDGRPVPIFISNRGLISQAGVDLVARRVFDYACHSKKKKSFAAPLWFVTPETSGDAYQVVPRPLKFGDIVTIDDVFYVVWSCSYQWQVGEGSNQMMALEVMQLPALDESYATNNQMYKAMYSKKY